MGQRTAGQKPAPERDRVPGRAAAQHHRQGVETRAAGAVLGEIANSQPTAVLPPFDKGGLGGISAEHPHISYPDSTACCETSAAGEYAAAEGLVTQSLSAQIPLSPPLRKGEAVSSPPETTFQAINTQPHG